MTITQSSEQSIIEWTSFDIGAQNSVTFNQSSINASALNRVAVSYTHLTLPTPRHG